MIDDLEEFARGLGHRLVGNYAQVTWRVEHYGAPPCHRQPGRQRWHLRCALRHPVTFLRTRSAAR